MTVVINSFTSNVIISSTEHRLITANGVVTGDNAVTFSSSSNSYSLTVMGAVSGENIGIRMYANDVLNVTSGGLVEARDDNGAEAISASNANGVINIAGDVYSEDLAILGNVSSDNLNVFIDEGGTVVGGGDAGGSSAGFSAAIVIFGEGSTVTNYGLVRAELNPSTGERVAYTNATYLPESPDKFDPDDAFQSTFVNGGTVIGDMRFQAGNDTYRGVADGFVVGRIDMGAGVDLMVGGSQSDNANGGAGNDALIGRAGDDDLVGAGGNDVIRGGKGDDGVTGGEGADRLYGGNGDDDIVAGSGADIITGGRGDDIMRGSSGKDTFVFKGGFGDDVIEDFAGSNAEKIDLSAVRSIRNFSDLTNNHLSQDGADAIIDAGNGNIITLEGFNAGALNAGDFIF